MLGLISVVFLSGSLNLSTLTELNSFNPVIETQPHNVTGLLNSYYKEFEHTARHGKGCHCDSEQHLQAQEILDKYYAEFIK